MPMVSIENEKSEEKVSWDSPKLCGSKYIKCHTDWYYHALAIIIMIGIISWW